ncbi:MULTISPECIES: pentapeptide MXKDX repeat protein [unclassified Caballeronia]|uniref:pentapeptide MXKDX repeat protein n=1 Tax=unclassified Caballeronia TaxID=2646786 RepID=UPI00285B6851|nr:MULTISPECIES: pentapeptide MXKDX repeat protein [unclassified Caballeronia]MDR5781538.1 pentapeptide MXKDX repeat protein [Caballeronia sp. LZ065]MDR5821858.1 pentapeptide MXKDX repeat protein [Caballeronia sp. LZ043]MDR5836502.1 pentapeptide MXKDX repeat protein [Caballeronia sp. LZ034LL]
MKRLMTVVIAAAMAIGTSAAFAQTNDAMSKDSMAKDSMSKDSMSKDGMKKDSMSHDSMGKGGKMKKHDAMGMGHPASGAMSQ